MQRGTYLPCRFGRAGDHDRRTYPSVVVHPISTHLRPSQPLSAACSRAMAAHCVGVLSPGQDYPAGSRLGSKIAGEGGLTFPARIRPTRIHRHRLQCL